MQVDPAARLVELLITSHYRFEDGMYDGQTILQLQQGKVTAADYDKIVAACRSLAAGIDISRLGWIQGLPEVGGDYLVALPLQNHYYNVKGQFKCVMLHFNPMSPDKWYCTNPNTGSSEPFQHVQKIVAHATVPQYGSEI
jgi:hypothetical protein